MKMKCTLFVVLISWVANAEIFTSIGQMTDLIYVEKELVQSLKEYVKAEESKIEMIKSWATKLDTLMHVSTSDPEGYLSHPVNAYKLVKRLKVEWLELANLVLLNLSGGFISNISRYWPYFPSDEDARGVAKAMIRLQDTYRLDPESFSKGKLPGVRDGALLTADDCFEMGLTASSEADHYHSTLWLQQALRQLDAGEMARVTKSSLLDFLSYSAYQMGDFPRAIEIIKHLVMIDPGHPNANVNLRYVEDLMAKGVQADQATSPAPAMAVPIQFGPYDRLHYHLPTVGVYEALCRGEGINMTPKRWSRLFCRYHNGNGNPRLLLAPVKEEDEWDSPRIVRYLDFLSDVEMEKIKGMARPRLSRAGVLDTKSGLGVAVDTRVSKSAWLGDWEDPVVARVTRRIEDVTGLTATTAELLQVVNYGIGGQYEPHFDFAMKDEPKAFLNLGTGNRVATFLNYMSDVAAGGATVFPSVRAAVWPRKGTAVFWYNLFRSGEGDYRTLHAACPVLVGSKWVSNKWFHEKSQEFRRPCGLKALD